MEIVDCMLSCAYLSHKTHRRESLCEGAGENKRERERERDREKEREKERERLGLKLELRKL